MIRLSCLLDQKTLSNIHFLVKKKIKIRQAKYEFTKDSDEVQPNPL